MKTTAQDPPSLCKVYTQNIAEGKGFENRTDVKITIPKWLVGTCSLKPSKLFVCCKKIKNQYSPEHLNKMKNQNYSIYKQGKYKFTGKDSQ